MSKMLVRLLVSRAGVNFSQSRGDEIEIDSDEGERMIAAHQCTFISGERGAAPQEPQSGAPDIELANGESASVVDLNDGSGGASGDSSDGKPAGFEGEGTTTEWADSKPVPEALSSKKKS